MAEIVFTNGDTIHVDGTASEVAEQLEEAAGATFGPTMPDQEGGIHRVNPAHVREVRESVERDFETRVVDLG